MNDDRLLLEAEKQIQHSPELSKKFEDVRMFLLAPNRGFVLYWIVELRYMKTGPTSDPGVSWTTLVRDSRLPLPAVLRNPLTTERSDAGSILTLERWNETIRGSDLAGRKDA
jgi:hypothetical protein